MSFLSGNIEISQTVFSKFNIEGHRRLLRQLFLEIGYDLDNLPDACFSSILRGNDNLSPLKSIWITYLIRQMRFTTHPLHGNRYKDKLIRLIEARNSNQFRDIWNEFESFQQITSRGVRAYIEPYVGDNEYGGAAVPPSPDYSISFNDIEYFFEITTLNAKDFENYSEAAQYVINTLSRLIPEELNRIVDISMPFKLDRQYISIQRLRILSKEIKTNEVGKVSIPTNSLDIEVRWQIMQSFATTEDFFASGMSAGVIGATVSNGRAINIQMRTSDEDEIYERLASSIKNKVKDKRYQMKRGRLNLLILHLAENHSSSPYMIPIINRAIRDVLVNKDFSWLDSIILTIPSKNYTLDNPTTNIIHINSETSPESRSKIESLFGDLPTIRV